jgi:hypothetical protein
VQDFSIQDFLLFSCIYSLHFKKFDKISYLEI